MDSDPHILLNRIITPDGTELVSRHRHDYVSHTDANGFVYTVDGGVSYLGRGWQQDAPPAKEASLTTEDDFMVCRQEVKWGTYGKDGDQPLRYVPIAEMETDHILAIRADYWQSLAPGFKWLFGEELKYRKLIKEGTNNKEEY